MATVPWTQVNGFSRLLVEGLSRSRGRTFERSRLIEEPAVTTPEVLQEASRGDRLARFIVGEVGRLNSIGVANLISLYDPSPITIGGGVAINNPNAGPEDFQASGSQSS